MSLEKSIKKLFFCLGFEIKRSRTRRNIPDKVFYRPRFSPWEGYGEFKPFLEVAKGFTLVSNERMYTLYALALQALELKGAFFEVGVYKGGTAMLLAKILLEKSGREDRRLHLFDTFEGMPETHPRFDLHKEGDFSDTSFEAVRERVVGVVGGKNLAVFHKGFVPETFKGLENESIAFAHIDVDIHQSVLDCCEFIYSRMDAGGFMVIDDYGFPSCPGARKAIDEFFDDKPEVPLVLPTGQAVIFRTVA